MTLRQIGTDVQSLFRSGLGSGHCFFGCHMSKSHGVPKYITIGQSSVRLRIQRIEFDSSRKRFDGLFDVFLVSVASPSEHGINLQTLADGAWIVHAYPESRNAGEAFDTEH